MYFLGIDGGGTGCRAVLGDAAGRVLGRGSAGPANINTDMDQAYRHIMLATQQAMARVDAAPSDLVAVLGLAGGNMTAAATRLVSILPFARKLVVNDAITAARGALGQRDGILAAIGTGSVFVVQDGGRLRQYGGHGFALGDEGSGAVLGRELLSQSLRAAEGLAPATPLLDEVLAELGGIEAVIAFANQARPADYARFASRIIAGDDPAAVAIRESAARQIGGILTRLQDGGSHPVVFLGGLGAFYAQALHGSWPVIDAQGTALDGALQMASELMVTP